LPQLGDTQAERAEPGIQRPVAIAVAAGLSFGRALVTRRADLAVNVRFHQHLRDGFGDAPQKIVFAGLFHQAGQRHSVLGHRGAPRFEMKLRNSTLAERSDDHLARADGD